MLVLFHNLFMLYLDVAASPSTFRSIETRFDLPFFDKINLIFPTLNEPSLKKEYSVLTD